MRRLIAGLAIGLVAVACAAQTIPLASKIDASNLDSSHLVETLKAHQRQLDPLREQYSFHETAEFLTLGDDGSVEKKTVSDYKMFYVNTHPVRVLLHRNGQPLNEEDATRTQQHLVKDTAKANSAPATTPGAIQGSVTLIVIRQAPAPSERAASSNWMSKVFSRAPTTTTT